jgi:hypothetical protein
VKVQDALRPTLAETAFKKLYANRVVDEIVNRTRDKNIDKNGKSLGKYSTEYKKSLVFQIYKDAGQKVDLTLTGEMLESLKANHSKYVVTVFLEGDNNRGKAQGHITGRLGKKGRAEKRDFLGLPPKEEERIFKESMKDYRNMSDFTLAEILS